METTKATIVALLLVLLTVGPARPAGQTTKAEPPAKPPAAKISNTRTANCLVKITCDPAILPLNTSSIYSLLRSSGVGQKAAQDVLGIPLVDNLFQITELPLGSTGGFPPPRTTTRPRSSALPGGSFFFGGPTTEPDSPSKTTPSPSRYGRTSPTDDYSAYPTRIATTPRRPTRTLATPPTPPAPQTLLFQLEVDLGQDAVKPAAQEFMKALIENLRETLSGAFETYTQELQIQLKRATLQHHKAQSELSEATKQAMTIQQVTPIGLDPADKAVYEQLDQMVDLSALTADMPFSEAIDVLRNSVEPPLKIVVLWRDLYDNADVEPTTPLNMDGLSAVAVGPALELLLGSVSGGLADLGYVVKNGVITIATTDSLPSKLETRVYETPSVIQSATGADDLIELIQNAIEPDSWWDNGGEGTIGIYLGRKLTILQTPEIHQKIQKFLQDTKVDIPIYTSADIPFEMLTEQEHKLLRTRQDLEMELARFQARRMAIQEQIIRTKDETDRKIRNDPITDELQRLIELQFEQLKKTKQLVEQGRASHIDLGGAEEKLARARIELAQRREQVVKSAGGDRLTLFNDDLAKLSIDLAETTAMLNVVNSQLEEAERKLKAASTFDPQAAELRYAMQALDAANHRGNELKTRIANLQPPTVTVLGAD